MHVFELYAAISKTVEIGCLALRMTKSTQGSIQIVRHEEQDIGSFRLRGRGADVCCQEQNQKHQMP